MVFLPKNRIVAEIIQKSISNTQYLKNKKIKKIKNVGF